MRRIVALSLSLLACGRSALLEPDGGADASVVAPVDAGRDAGGGGGSDAGVDAGRCVPGQLRGGSPTLVGPRFMIPYDEPHPLDAVMTDEGPIFLVTDQLSARVMLLQPGGWTREYLEPAAPHRPHLAWNGSQLAATWQAGPELVLALFDADGTLQHRLVLATGRLDEEVAVAWADGTWVVAWTRSTPSVTLDIWATRVHPNGMLQNLTQRLTSTSLRPGFPTSSLALLASDAGLSVLALGETATLVTADLYPSPRTQTALVESRCRGALTELADGGLHATYFGAGPNARRPDLLTHGLPLTAPASTLARAPSLFSVADVAATSCGTGAVYAYTDDLAPGAACANDYCDKPLLHYVSGAGAQAEWLSPERDGGYVRGAAFFRAGADVNLVWLSVGESRMAQVAWAVVATCCDGP